MYKSLIENVPNFKKYLKKCLEYSLDTGFASIELTGLNKKVTFKSDELEDKKKAHSNFKVNCCCNLCTTRLLIQAIIFRKLSRCWKTLSKELSKKPLIFERGQRKRLAVALKIRSSE
jgi:hypothetical protein